MLITLNKLINSCRHANNISQFLCKLTTNIIPRNQIHGSVTLLVPRHPSNKDNISPGIAMKYKLISDRNPENDSIEPLEAHDRYSIVSDEFDGINLERGKNGVFEIEDLVDLLQRESARNIFVATVPREINYVDYICIVSGKSKRHILALAEFIRKVYKKKCLKDDFLPKIEGKTSEEWMALDLGNIALHIFSDKARQTYDLETLWAVGSEFDEQTNKRNEVVEIFENYSKYLKDLKPLES